jgi:hypothetical protein
MTENDDESVDVDVNDSTDSTSTSGKMVTVTQERLNQMMAKARAQGRGERVERTSTREPSRLDRIEGALEKLAGAMAPQPQPDPARSGAAAPRAPTGAVNPYSHGGLTDLWSMDVATLDALGPQGIRKIHEQALEAASNLRGVPRKPSTKMNKR